jgi:aspartate carbamoyltransferase catalytic subunit
MKKITWQDYGALDISERIPYLSRSLDSREPFHVIYSQQFNRRILDEVCALADRIRAMHKSEDGREFLGGLLARRTALNLFAQPSTRTYLSFQVAEQKLGMDTSDIRDISTSSQAKGESLQNCIRTISSYVDLIVMRHPDQGAAELAAYEMNMAERRIPVINGGSGRDQHPTQAVLDIYTLTKSLGAIDGKRIAMVGDLLRGRTVRSLSYLLKNYEDVEVVYVAPDRLRIADDIREFLVGSDIPYTETDDLAAVVGEVDAVYMTRIQWEWDLAAAGAGPAEGASDPRFVFKREYLDSMKPDACLMHPLPKLNEIDPALDYSDDPRVVYWRQERNGMWIRAALIARIHGLQERIMGYED